MAILRNEKPLMPLKDDGRLPSSDDVLVLGKASSSLGAGLFSLVVLLMSFAMLGEAALEGPDPMTRMEVYRYSSAMSAASLLAFLLLARNKVVISKGRFLIVNPIRTYSGSLESIDRIEERGKGFASLSMCGRRVRVIALETSLSDQLAGGNSDTQILRDQVRLAKEPGVHQSDKQLSVRLTRPGWPLAALIVAWAIYWSNFIL